MIATIVLWLVGKGVPERLTRPLIYAAAALAFVAAVVLAIHLHTRKAIREHDAAITAAVATASARADDAANAADAALASEAAARASDNQETINAAVQAHPVEVRRPVGPATDALADRLRARQGSARIAAGKPR